MTRKYFGTDGIRGTANRYPMTADVAQRCAMAAAHVLRARSADGHNRVVIGKDTRLSCYMLEQAMASGFLAMGMEVIFLGPVPTPAVAGMTRSLRADLGVMISASHNPYQDNGIKLFGHDGYKLSDETEHEIETAMDNGLAGHLAEPDDIGQAYRLDSADGRYIEYIKSALPRGMRLDGLKIVLDCANGAAYKVAPKIFWELGAEVTAIGVSPDGRNINDQCGATDTEALQTRVVREKAHAGVALDGDADRIIMVDAAGRRIDGDQLMAVLARDGAEKGWLAGGGIVATQMSNLGLERYVRSLGLGLERTAVGDRYVVERMRETGMNLGGEQSGHIVLSDYSTTGDGLLAAVRILGLMVESGRTLADMCDVFQPVPQILHNIRLGEGVRAADLMQHADIARTIAAEQENLNGGGRILVRPSGTEPMIRVMAEGDEETAIKASVDRIAGCINALSGGGR